MVVLDPHIPQLDHDGLTYAIYIQLYTNFFNAQDQKSEDNPFGIEEGDETSIRLRNTAYNFASAIAGAVDGGGTGPALNYVKKTGDIMTGLLKANNGFEAGVNNAAKLIVDTDGVNIVGKLSVGGNSFYLDGKQVLKYDKATDTVSIDSTTIQYSGQIILGDKVTGVVLSPDGIKLGNKDVYHTGNANLASADWKMKNANVAGNIDVSGKTALHGQLSALYGASFGFNNKAILSFTAEEEAMLSGNLRIGDKYGILIGDKKVIYRNLEDLHINAATGNLYLGDVTTQSIRLLSDIKNDNGQNTIITKYGGGFFPDGLRAKHDFGKDVLQTYKTDDNNQGIIIPERLRFGVASGTYLTGGVNSLLFHSEITKGSVTTDYQAQMSVAPSVSYYKPLNRESYALNISTTADMIRFAKFIEVKESIGIDGSATRLLNGSLFFSNTQYLLAINGGIKYYGNAQFVDNISSEKFISGFAGEGWAIIKNALTGNVQATFDEVVIRKKLRAYELEVQKFTGTNGALWVSDSCSADKVEKL